MILFAWIYAADMLHYDLEEHEFGFGRQAAEALREGRPPLMTAFTTGPMSLYWTMGFIAAFGHDYATLHFRNLTAGFLILGALHVLLRKLTRSLALATAGVLLYATYPEVMNGLRLWSYSFAGAFLWECLAWILLIDWRSSRSDARLAAAAFFAGLPVCHHFSALPFLAAWVAALWLSGRVRRRDALLAAAGLLVAVSPILVFNALNGGSLVRRIVAGAAQSGNADYFQNLAERGHQVLGLFQHWSWFGRGFPEIHPDASSWALFWGGLAALIAPLLSAAVRRRWDWSLVPGLTAGLIMLLSPWTPGTRDYFHMLRLLPYTFIALAAWPTLWRGRASKAMKAIVLLFIGIVVAADVRTLRKSSAALRSYPDRTPFSTLEMVHTVKGLAPCDVILPWPIKDPVDFIGKGSIPTHYAGSHAPADLPLTVVRMEEAVQTPACHLLVCAENEGLIARDGFDHDLFLRAFRGAAARRNLKVEPLRTIRNEAGRPMFTIYRMPPPPGSSPDPEED